MKSRTITNAERDSCAIPSLKKRSLLSPIQAGGLAAVFKVLANDTRLRLLHALVRSEELCVTDLAIGDWHEAAGRVQPASAAFRSRHPLVPPGWEQHLLPLG